MGWLKNRRLEQERLERRAAEESAMFRALMSGQVAIARPPQAELVIDGQPYLPILLKDRTVTVAVVRTATGFTHKLAYVKRGDQWELVDDDYVIQSGETLCFEEPHSLSETESVELHDRLLALRRSLDNKGDSDER